MIDFVHHQMPVALAGSLGEAGQLVTLEHCTRGVGRRGHQGTDSVFVPVAVDQVGRQLIIDVRPYRYQLRPTFDQTQEVAVARVAGVGQQPVLARIDQQTAGQQQRTGSARGDEDPFRVDAHPVALVVETCNRLAQGGQAAGRGVAGVARGQGRLASRHDGRGGGEVRLADLQVDDIMASRLQLIGARQQRHDVEGFDSATACTVGLSHGPSLNWV